MENNLIITIGRQYGSGGHQIARELSKLLGIKMYDKEIVEQSAIKSGIAPEVLRMYDEHPTNSLLYSLSVGVHPMSATISGMHYEPTGDRVFKAQAEIIRQIANEESCIFVGRCANSILKNRPNVLSVFIHTDLERRISRICEYENISRTKAADIIKKADKRRAGYCSHFTDMKWGVATNYDLCINSAIGYDNAAQLIKFFSQHHK